MSPVSVRFRPRKLLCFVSICVLLLVNFPAVHMYTWVVPELRQGSIIANRTRQAEHLPETTISTFEGGCHITHPKRLYLFENEHLFFIFFICAHRYFMRRRNYVATGDLPSSNWLKIDWWSVPFGYVAKMVTNLRVKSGQLVYVRKCAFWDIGICANVTSWFVFLTLRER